MSIHSTACKSPALKQLRKIYFWGPVVTWNNSGEIFRDYIKIEQIKTWHIFTTWRTLFCFESVQSTNIKANTERPERWVCTTRKWRTERQAGKWNTTSFACIDAFPALRFGPPFSSYCVFPVWHVQSLHNFQDSDYDLLYRTDIVTVRLLKLANCAFYDKSTISQSGL